MISPVRVSEPETGSLRADDFEIPKSSTLTSGVPSRRLVEKEVRGLQIAMDDAERVRLGERVARLQDVLDRLFRRQRPARRQHAREIGPVQVLHHDVRSARLERADVAHTGDVLAVKPHGGARLAQEARDGIGAPERLGQHELQRDHLVELDVRGRDHDPHPADAEHPRDAVFPRKHVPGRDRRHWAMVPERRPAYQPGAVTRRPAIARIPERIGNRRSGRVAGIRYHRGEVGRSELEVGQK